MISQASIMQFIEDNWLRGQRLGGGSFDATTGSIMDMFDFSSRPNPPLFLSEQTGEPTSHPVGTVVHVWPLRPLRDPSSQ